MIAYDGEYKFIEKSTKKEINQFIENSMKEK